MHHYFCIGFGSKNQAVIRLHLPQFDAAGVAVEAVVLPHRSPDATHFFRRADLTLISPGEPIPTIFAQRLRDREIPFIDPALPFGVSGTLRWLGAVLDALGLGALDEGLAEELKSGTRARIAPLRQSVQEHGVRAAVCFDAGTVQELLDPRSFFGVDILELFEDTGCELNLVAFPRRPSDEEHDTRALEILEARGVRLVTHPIGADPDEALREHRFEHVYCDVEDGAPVKRHGSLPMDIKAFRMGLEGTVANARLFAAATRFALYRRYHAYLARPADPGQAVEP